MKKLYFIQIAKKDNLMLFKHFSINLNAQNVNGVTHFDIVENCTAIRYNRVLMLS